MSTQPLQTQQVQTCGFSRPTIAESILVILLGLTAKGALDQLLGPIANIHGLWGVWIWLVSDPPWHFCVIFQAIIFFATAFRFYLGALRYHQMRGPYLAMQSLIWDVIGTLIIFAGFYACALSLRSQGNFYPFMGILHVFDSIWFGVAWVIGTVPLEQQLFMRRFIFYDLVTVFLFAMIAFLLWILHFSFGPPFVFQGFCFCVLLGIGIWDFYRNAAFYRGVKN
jgi:hypothetical protein